MSVVVQPRQQRSTKGIAGADRIYKMDRYGFHTDPQVSMRPERTGGPESDDNETHPTAQELFGCIAIANSRKHPHEIVLTCFHDGAARRSVTKPFSIDIIRNQSRADVGIEHHHACGALAVNELHESGRHRLEDHAEGSKVEGIDLWAETVRHHGEGQLGRGRVLHQELIYRETIAIDVCTGPPG